MTQRWTDDAGREWLARIDIATADELRASGLDLLNPEALSAAMADPFNVVRLLCTCHKKQWQERAITEGDFAELVTATEEVALRAAGALEVALADFFRRMRRPALAGVVESASKAAKAADQVALAKLADPRIDQALAAVLEREAAKVDEAIEAAIAGRKSGS